jgi:hypothetical protein
MQTITSLPITAALSVPAGPIESIWVEVAQRLPDDGERVQVMLEQSLEIRTAWRGHYQSTGAWFDARTRTPIYETVLRWRA